MTVGVRSRPARFFAGNRPAGSELASSRSALSIVHGAWDAAKARPQHRRLLPLDPRPLLVLLARPDPDARPSAVTPLTNRGHSGGQTTEQRRSRESQPRPALADLGMIAQTVAHGEGHPVGTTRAVADAALHTAGRRTVLRPARTHWWAALGGSRRPRPTTRRGPPRRGTTPLRPTPVAPRPRGGDVARGCPPAGIQRQLGHANLAITSVYLRGIDNTEIVHTVHERPAPTSPAHNGLSLH
jgi:hypothetical protein